MKLWVELARSCMRLFLSISILGGFATCVVAQGTETEPNHPCTAAQQLGTVTLPFTLSGSLDSTPQQADIDFFHFTGTPHTFMQVDLEGTGTGQGTLVDPFLGLFSSACEILIINDEGGTNSNARLVFEIPSDGVFLIAATACCDFAFAGGGTGSYRLMVTAIQAVRSIRGRVVDVLTGAPLAGDDFPFTTVELHRCLDNDCVDSFFENEQAPDSQGQFRFTRTSFDGPLVAGRYQVRIRANTYQPTRTDPFRAALDANKALGDILLTPVPRIQSIRGRVIDAVTSAPLGGEVPPFAEVELLQCSDNACVDASVVHMQRTDAQGRFNFTRDASGNPLLEGRYLVSATAREYQQRQKAPFNVAGGANQHVGSIPLEPFPAGISEVRPCGDLPPEGGVCRYSMRVTNRSGVALQGVVWSLVKGTNIGALVETTRFQVRPLHQVNLASQESTVLQFAFAVPSTVQNGARLCAEAFVGQAAAGSTPADRNNFFFNTLATRQLFCIDKGTTGEFRVTSEKEAHLAWRRMRRPTLPSFTLPERGAE